MLLLTLFLVAAVARPTLLRPRVEVDAPPVQTVSGINSHRCPGPGAASIFSIKAGTYYVTDAGVTVAEVSHASENVRERAQAAVKGAAGEKCCLLEDLSSSEVEQGSIVCGVENASPSQAASPASETVMGKDSHMCPGSVASSFFTKEAGTFYITDAGITIAELATNASEDIKERARATVKGSSTSMCCLDEDLSGAGEHIEGKVICKA